MPQSLTQIFVHLIFSTKERRPFLADRNLREEMHKYLGGTCNGLGCPVLRIGGVADHVHMLFGLGRTISIADLVKELKRSSSRWANERATARPEFHWQNGYAAFSIGSDDVRNVIQYIDDQEEHHRIESFQDELRRVLSKYGVESDERYVWD